MSKVNPCPKCGSEANAELAAGYLPTVSCPAGCHSISDYDSPWLNDIVEKWNSGDMSDIEEVIAFGETSDLVDFFNRPQQIKLKLDLFEKVQSGSKTATMRKGIRNITLGRAEFVDPNDSDKRISIIVSQLELWTWDQIINGSSIHTLEGYGSPSELEKALTDIYGEISPEQEMTVIRFRLEK